MKLKHSLFLIVIALTIIACNKTGSGSAEESVKEDLSVSLLLRDFRPQSIFNIPINRVERAMFPVIDMHAHDYAKDTEGVEEWIETMDKVGIERTIVMTGATGARFDSIVALYAGHGDRFDVWCTFDYTGYDKPGFGPAAVAELERCVSMGAKGVGELGDKGKGLFYNREAQAWGMHADDPRMDPLFEKCAELDLAIAIDDSINTWTQTTFAEDTGRPLVVVNHGSTEEFGMKELSVQLNKALDQHEALHFKQGCSYRWLTA